ncbi:hypothetical protein DRF67_15880 [Chryseobacterium pennipullorum]|uniref:Uncharacterized protein n=1 Tax=Chryseobacterium pennipullorum TaxID=2258963 RepID=A0A3D9AW09_9FLAO|nr:hypothetical protein DRF67_15880 [Chryseobacterium pennipullorum]
MFNNFKPLRKVKSLRKVKGKSKDFHKPIAVSEAFLNNLITLLNLNGLIMYLMSRKSKIFKIYF